MKRSLSLACMLLAMASIAWASGSSESSAKKPIVVVWLPNDSPPESQQFRMAMDKIVADATGRPVQDKLTTDYNIAIQAMATDNAAIALFGAYQYVQARALSKNIVPLVTNTGDSGTMSDAVYYSRIVVKSENAAQYMSGDSYSIANIQGKRFSFVSNSSTSGFLFPSAGIVASFSKTDKWSALKQADLMEGGSDKLFTQVLFGGSHQGSLANVLTGKADAGACDDVDIANYVTLVSGKESTPGAVYQINSGASEPFDQLAGQKFTVLWSIPVLNGPVTANAKLLSPDELSKITAAFTSDATMHNSDIFQVAGSNNKADFTQTGKVRFVAVTDDTYGPVRAMME